MVGEGTRGGKLKKSTNFSGREEGGRERGGKKFPSKKMGKKELGQMKAKQEKIGMSNFL